MVTACEACQWWDAVIGRTEARVRAARDRWGRTAAERQRDQYAGNKAEHVRRNHGGGGSAG
ncbi:MULTISPECIES: hypothetical protein [Streptomyces]|uniref:hypothetical protein n=1 Tax=Streptomyces TaxID=1883 RepID=UPI00182E471D|nr:MULTISPECIES: hypothetical protein [Streptomyces]MBC2873888.1 hypothetical protein [Streptomyces sp. TYQ1024]UBI39167.1 hypothetical protein K7I03_23735 [Streptomyces mobaraensis]UKW31747.1 hypothetical protein MCU78_23675 [Streptomyces sp. TYQ1024]